MKHSIIRRSLIVIIVFVAGNLFHYALMVSANRILEPGIFGRFYTAISLLNVMLTPATVLTFMFAQHFSEIFLDAGIGPLTAELRFLIRWHFCVGMGLVLICVLALFLVGSFLGADALTLLVLVPILALFVYLFEMVRAALQSMLDFFAYSMAWIGWRALQFVLAAAGLLFLGSAWAGIAGILLATVLALLALVMVVFRRASPTAPASTHWTSGPFRVTGAVPFLIEYGIFILVTNFDVLVAYLILTNDQLGVYSASSILPKAIVTATLPITQVMLPVMSVAGAEWQPRRNALLKALGLCSSLSALGVAVLMAGSELICNDRFGIRFCSTGLLATLALSAIPLALLRVLIVAGLALPTQHHVIFPGLAVLAFTVISLAWIRTPDGLAFVYTGFCWLFLMIYGAVTMNGLREEATVHKPLVP
jgi:O-antigen/teichoic acid export membrane protein